MTYPISFSPNQSDGSVRSCWEESSSSSPQGSPKKRRKTTHTGCTPEFRKKIALSPSSGPDKPVSRPCKSQETSSSTFKKRELFPVDSRSSPVTVL